ncbi:hypothetical protein D884_04236 [Pseudomonas sp. URMO17WK12:I10]|jgi:hypothetical protein|nr:hypothetical protein H040_02019 [Pseudomonas sp. URMO17WK12:I7]RDL14392.1 hypothetical protein F633_04227 [Pseudomonas sp. LAMO17WK12:I3]RED00854.1 hypothetical protein D884_04236 [Pseudomonas sp. URMO17WK12:I10]SMF18202.1 hypothetical protein SAMN02745962_02074 [Pseudomonas sp. LAIL14HWK12:I11]SMF18782.1 hypothetical protein SAMN02745903_01955 [Pseudomonas sp. URMO17WK12:I5]SMR77380.1 hypothetical protein SAMN05661028_02819 [Pseudomonas sp. LAIL14HWK12:I10]SNB78835.1 hypothetical protein 
MQKQCKTDKERRLKRCEHEAVGERGKSDWSKIRR